MLQLMVTCESKYLTQYTYLFHSAKIFKPNPQRDISSYMELAN